ncbi:MAG: YdcF family protein [Pseudomonadota bacterium]|nr:YdcF family protein [Pseudomonadota bacterium]
MFVFSKLFWIIANPANIFVFLLVFGSALLLTRFRRTGRKLVLGASAILVFFAILPIGGWLTEQLENRFPGNPEIPSDVAGIIMLGGTINQHITSSRQQPSLTAGGERFNEFMYLARRFPNARLIFTGGSGSIIDQSFKEASAAKFLFDRMGVKEGRVKYENNSRNTYENAVLSRPLAGNLITRKWVLVTSALHMPRAVGVFRKAGWNILPYPVDYLTDGSGSFQVGFQPLNGMATINRGVREWVGLLAYWALGRIDTFFPKPDIITDN